MEIKTMILKLMAALLTSHFVLGSTLLPSNGNGTLSVAAKRQHSATIADLAPPASWNAEDMEYYNAYEYPDIINNSGVEPGLIPDPRIDLARRSGLNEEEVEVALPDDSLADTDLHDHDVIDSVMYIYFGRPSRAQGGAGRQILIIGAAISLVAEFLCLATALRRLRFNSQDPATCVLLNTQLSLIPTSLVFMLGIQATADRWWCELIALLLHYLHLVSCGWLFSVGLLAYCRLKTKPVQHQGLLCTLIWLLPALLVLVCHAITPMGYETRSYCWLSVKRGMLLSYMAPVASLILASTILSVMGLRILTQQHVKEGEVLRRSLWAAVILLPLFAIVWFLAVLSLENHKTLVFPLLFAASNIFFNWFLFLCSGLVLPCASSASSPRRLHSTDMGKGSDTEPLLSDPCTPVHSPQPQPQPPPSPTQLLVSSSPSRGAELLELRLDSISTISS